jgi:hypothetical protein
MQIDMEAIYYKFNRHPNREYVQQRRKVKGEVVPLHAVKAYRGSRGIAPLILRLGTKG